MKLQMLRDPIWQFVGAVVSIIAIIIPLLFVDKQGRELAVVPSAAFASTFLLPKDRFSILYRSTDKRLDKAIIDVILVENPGKNAIRPVDFVVPLTVVSKLGKLISVSSCDGDTQIIGRPWTVKFSWTQDGDKWTAVPTLFNSDDAACILVVTEPLASEQDAKDENYLAQARVDISAQIADVKVKYYSSLLEYMSFGNQSWTDRLQ